MFLKASFIRGKSSLASTQFQGFLLYKFLKNTDNFKPQPGDRASCWLGEVLFFVQNAPPGYDETKTVRLNRQYEVHTYLWTMCQ